MTIEEIFNLGKPGDIIEQLKKKSVTIPEWSKLEQQYNPDKHPVMTDPSYKDTVKKGKIIRVSRVKLGLQKLAVKRMTQLTFGIPVTRVYTYDENSEKEKKAAKIIESILVKNRIDSLNIKRFKEYFAACEMATLWYSVDTKEKHNDYGESVNKKIRCRYFSPRLNDEIYPLFDEFDDMIALSFGYTRKEGNKDVKYFDTYTDSQHICWREADGEWAEEANEAITIEKIPGIYTNREESIWEDTSESVYEQEWSLSRTGNYLRKNSRPIFGVFSDGKTEIGGKSKEGEDEALAVMKLPEKAKAEYISWDQAIDSLKYFNDTLYRQTFTQLQLPDISFDNMKASPMSGEARLLMFTDAILKVTEESGDIVLFLDREINVIKALARAIFPSMKEAINAVQVENIITPFSVKSDKDKAETLMTLTGNKALLSQKSGVKILNYVANPEEELTQLQQEELMQTNGAYE